MARALAWLALACASSWCLPAKAWLPSNCQLGRRPGAPSERAGPSARSWRGCIGRPFGRRAPSHATVAAGGTAGPTAGPFGEVPGPALEGTRWSLLLDIGRTTFTFMPLGWASGGVRVELPVAVEFCPGGRLAVVGAGAFLGEWLQPEEVPTLVQFVPALQLVLPQREEVLARPSISDGKWRVAEDGRLVQFYVETSGFRRGTVWLPPGRLRFRANAYGQLLAPGTEATVTIRESRAVFGALFGAFAGLTMGPAAVVACGLAAGLALRRVVIVVGRWAPSRLEDGGESVTLPPVKLVQDDPGTWQ